MGFFDRLLGKSSSPRRNGTHPATPPPAAAASSAAPTPPAPAPGDAGPVAPKLAAALELLELRDLDGARAIYEEVLAGPAGDRPDVLVRISGDLGATGHIPAIVELIAPRYDADRHGPATGINLLQAYLAQRNPEAAQHVLDLLFELKKPELEDRLWGFSNAIGELMDARRRGTPGPGAATHINLVTISKPIWAYGIEDLPGLLPPKDDRVRRLAIGQLALPGRADAEARAQAPEDALGRFSRGFPLWLAETLYFSGQYSPVAAVGLVGQDHYAHFPAEWTGDNIRQLLDSSSAPIDYVITGALREHDADYALTLRLWEIKGFRERKTFEVRWTPATADQTLAKLHEALRVFFEFKPLGAGLTYQPPVRPTVWIDTLAASLSTFLADKGVLPRTQLAPLPATLADPTEGDAAALARLTLADRCRRVDLAATPPELVAPSPLVSTAAAQLGF